MIEFTFPWQKSRLPAWQRIIEASGELFGCLDREHGVYAVCQISSLALVSNQNINSLPNEREKLSRGSMILVGHGFGGTIIKNVSEKAYSSCEQE